MDRKKCKGVTKKGNKCRRYAKKDDWCAIHQPLPIEDTIITITFCECSENHVGMEKNGKIAEEGFKKENLDQALKWALKNDLTVDLYTLNSLLDLDKLKEEGIKDVKDEDVNAWVLVIRGGASNIATNLFEELIDLEWDKKYYDRRRKRVLNKNARWNMCIDEEDQSPDYKNKKGTIYSFKKLPGMNKIRNTLPKILGNKAKNLVAEGNMYRDGGKAKNGIGYHGDSERRLVVGVRVGKQSSPLLQSGKKVTSSPLHYAWYYKSKRITDILEVPLNSGDMYIMSQKAVGTDWKKRNTLTLRHATGAPKYTRPKQGIGKK